MFGYQVESLHQVGFPPEWSDGILDAFIRLKDEGVNLAISARSLFTSSRRSGASTMSFALTLHWSIMVVLEYLITSAMNLLSPLSTALACCRGKRSTGLTCQGAGLCPSYLLMSKWTSVVSSSDDTIAFRAQTLHFQYPSFSKVLLQNCSKCSPFHGSIRPIPAKSACQKIIPFSISPAYHFSMASSESLSPRTS